MRTKKSCCRDSPRCKRCPVVWKRLEKASHAQRTGKREYHVVNVVTKSAMAIARAR